MTSETTTAVAIVASKVPSLKSGDDAAKAKELVKRFKDAQTGMRRIIALGLFAWEIKQGLKHGQWGPWLAEHAPELSYTDAGNGKAKSSRALNTFMHLTKGVLETVGFTVGKYLAHISNSHTMRICQGGKFLLMPEKKIPEEVKPLRDKIFSLVDGKTQRQLFMEFKQAEDEDDATPKRGRLKGKGGASKEQREKAAQREEAARIEEMEIRATEVTEWATEMPDAKHIALVDEKIRGKLLPALEVLVTYMRQLAKSE